MHTKLDKTSFIKKLYIDVTLLFFIILLLIYGGLMVWSASGQNVEIMEKKIIQIIFGIAIMFILAQLPQKKYEYYAPYLYLLCLILLILVDICGETTKGAKRWLNIGLFRFQPSEITKIAVPLMVANYINNSTYPIPIQNVITAIILIFIPTILVAIEPDLGTAILIAISGWFVLFLSGIHWYIIITMILSLIIFTPILWLFFMQDYQKNRIFTLLHPDIDPLGSGYHILQSKIAIGSGGLIGKGWLHGTQSQLEFLPEKHTDFIFAVLAEELGLIGIIILLFMYCIIITRGLYIAKKSYNTFGRVTAGSFILILFVYIFVNISMVTGILPVVGIPLPLISYGGTSLIVIMANFGIVMSIHSNNKYCKQKMHQYL